MATEVSMAALLERSFHEDEDPSLPSSSDQKDLRALSSAIMAASERAELVAHETDRWLTGHQEFDNLDLVHALISEAEGRLIQLQKMTVVRELDTFMRQITVNAPNDQAVQLNNLVTSTKDTFSSAIESLTKFIHRAESIQSAYTKYKDSAFTLSKALTDVSTTLQSLSDHEQGDLSEIGDQVSAVRESRDMLTRMKTCLRNMKDAMAGIESLTLSVCNLGMDDYVKQYKHRRAELSEALARLEHLQSQLETFADLRQRCETMITDLSNSLNSQQRITDGKELDYFREEAEKIQTYIQDMERVVESLRTEGAIRDHESQLGSIRDGYSTLINILSAAASSSYQSSITGSPRVSDSARSSPRRAGDSARSSPRRAGDSARSSPRRSPRKEQSESGTPRQSLRQWLREKTAELQELMAEPFPFDDQNIQKFWHNIQKYQGDLVVRGEEFSLYGAESDGEQATMDQITPLIDTCADLSYRLDTHARLCVQYTADQNGLRSELKGLEESKEHLQHSDVPLKDQYHMVGDLLVQVSSLKRRTHDQLHNKLPAITCNLAKNDVGTLLTETSELEALVSKLKLEVKAFHQSLDNSISNLGVLTKQLRELLVTSSQVETIPDNFILNEPITYENVENAMDSCQRQIEALQERQRYIGKLLSEKQISIGRLPSPDHNELEEEIHKSTQSAQQTLNKLHQHHSKLSNLHQTLKTFTVRCDEARDRLHAAETLLHKVDASTNTEEPVEITVETVTVECKTRLRECVTCIEQAEIAVTELEQRNTSAEPSALNTQKEEIKEIQAKHKVLAAQLRDKEKKQAVIADQQKSLEGLMRRYDDWIQSAEATVSEPITLNSGLNDMRDHIIKLHELENSEETTQSWLTEMRKIVRTLSQSLPAAETARLSELVTNKESQFERLKNTLKGRISELSAQMEMVIAWVQRSSDLIGRLNQVKHSMTDLSNKETNEQTVQTKIKMLKSHIGDVENLQRELEELVKTTPPSVSEKQRRSSQNALDSCSTVKADLTVMCDTLTQVNKVWSEFDHAAAEVRGHQKHCASQLSAVELDGVTLDARHDRYQEICVALEHYPEGASPQYLQDLLSTCPIASPGLYKNAVSLSQEHDKILNNAKKGASQYAKELQVRSVLEADLQTVNSKLREIGIRLQSSLLLEDWDVKSCDLLTKALKTEEMELKAISDKITPRIKSQKEAHRQRDETMVIDLRESIDVYEETHRELMALIAQESEVMVLAREFCQYITESLDKIQTCLQQAESVCSEVESGQLTQHEIESALETNLARIRGDNSELSRHLHRVESYKDQILSSLSPAAQERLRDTVRETRDRTNAMQQSLLELLDHHGKLGQTKLKYDEQHREIQHQMDRMRNLVTSAADLKTRNLTESQAKLAQIQVLDDERAKVDSCISELVQTASELMPMMSNQQERRTYETSVKALCADQWGEIINQLTQMRSDTESVHTMLSDVESQQQAVTGSEYTALTEEVSELASVNLSTLSMNDLDRLGQRACQCSADVSQLWQKFLSAKDSESSLMARLGGDSTRPSSTTRDTGNKLSSLATECQNLESEIEKASTQCQQACSTLTFNLERCQQLSQKVKEADYGNVRGDNNLSTQREILEGYKNDLATLYQASNEVVSSFKPNNLPPDVASVMDSIQEENKVLLEDIQQRLGQTDRLIEQWDVVNVMQQDLEKWMNNTMQALSGDVVDAQVAMSQQRDLEERVLEYTEKLKELTCKTQDMEKAVSSPETQRLLETVSHFKRNISGIKQGLEKRREHVADLLKEEESFQTDLVEVGRLITGLENLSRQEVSDISPEKCQQLATNYQDELRKIPEIEQKLNDLVTLSVRLGDSSHHSDSVTRVLDLKKDWSSIKSQITNQATALKEATRVLLSAPVTVVSHEEWKTTYQAIEADTEDSLRDLQHKIDGSEQMHTDEIMTQLKLYEAEDTKIKQLHCKIEEINDRRTQLQTASMDPLMVRDWAGQILSIEGELKQLYMRSDEAMKRKSTIVEKASKLAEQGLKRERMDDPVAPIPSQVLDLSMDSEQYMSEEAQHRSAAPVTQHRPSLSQDEHAAKLFSVERSADSNAAEAQMKALISEHESLQTTLADVNRQVSVWQHTLDQEGNTTTELKTTASEIQAAKSKLEQLYKDETAAQEPSLSVLSMSLETLELRCLSELQRIENKDSLTLGHKETLNSIEEEVVACQKYLDYLDTMPGGAEEKLPSVEHRVSKLQRMYQTLQLINPSLCEGSHVSEYLGQLMNDLQILQGRLEVIPEEGDLPSHHTELHRWHESMPDTVSQHEAESDADYVDNVVCSLNGSLNSLTRRNLLEQGKQSNDSSQLSLNAYRELLSAAKCGLHTDRLTESENASQNRQNILNLFTLFETYRLYLNNIQSTTADSTVRKSLSKLISDTHFLQNELWCKSEHLQRLIGQTDRLNKHCDHLINALTHLQTDYAADKINDSRLERKLKQTESEYQGLVVETTQHLETQTRSPELKEKCEELRELWLSLHDLISAQSNTGIEDESVQHFSELLLIQTNTKRKLDTAAPLNHCVSQALDILVEYDTLNWLYKDLYSGKEDSDLDLKSKMLSLRPQANSIRADLQSKLRTSSSASAEDLQKIYVWLGDIKPFKKSLTSIASVSEYLHELLGYQCDLSQRSYITGLMMSLISSSNHDVIMTSQQTVKTLHEAKVVASKQLSSVHTLREAYKVFEFTKRRYERWISDAQSVTKECPIGSGEAVNWILSKCKALHDEGVKLSEYKQTFTQQSSVLTSHQLCTQSAVREVSRHVKDINEKQVSCLKELESTLRSTEIISENWSEFTKLYSDNSLTLDGREYLLESTPTLNHETMEEFSNLLTSLKAMLDQSNRETDRLQPIAQKLRLSITTPHSLQALDTLVKEAKSKEYKLFSQKLPLVIERWQKARTHMDKYEKGTIAVTEIIEATAMCIRKDNSAVTLRDLESSLSDYQHALDKLDTIKWSEIERSSSNVGQLTGIVLHQATCQRKQVDALRRHMTGMIAETTEKCAKCAHCAQTIHTLEHKLNRLQNEPGLTIAIDTKNYEKLLERRSRTEQLLYDLVMERNTLDDLHTSYSTGVPLSKEQVDLIGVLETKYSKVLDFITSRLVRIQEEVIGYTEANELQSAYQDWKNQVIQVTSQQIVGDTKELQEMRSKCLLHVNLSETERMSLTKVNKPSCSRVDHNKLVKSLTERETELQSILTKHKLFSKLKDTVMHSLKQLDTHLTLSDKTYGSHLEMSDKIPVLKSTFEQHQRASLIMRQVCQELLPHCEGSHRTNLLTNVQKASSQWQAILSKLISQSEESSNVITSAKSFTSSVCSLAKELGNVRQGVHGTLPDHHDHLQERQSQADVFQWRMDKMTSKSAVLKFDLTNLQTTLENPTDIETCFNISQCLSTDSDALVNVLKHELGDRLSVWSSFVSRVNTTLQDIQRIESLYMNEKRLTIEELLDEILTIYSADLHKLTHKSTELISEGTELLAITGDLYGSAVKHGIVSLQNSLKHVTRLASTRTSKLRDTMSAILEFEAGMKSLNQWFKSTEASLKYNLNDWQESTVSGSQQYLAQLEKDIKHHSRTVTAVINLCSLLQYDRDAGYDQTVKKELSAVKDRLNNRWKNLCDKIIQRRDELHELSQAWSQMKSQTDSLIESLTKYKLRCEDYSRTRVLHHRAKNSDLEEFSKILRDCESKHEDMRLLNNRHRFLIRQSMLDSSGCIKNAVLQCTDLWDTVYRSVTSLVKEMRASHEAWTEFAKDREVLLAKISNLSLQLKTRQLTRDQISERLGHYQIEVNEIFGLPVTKLRSTCTTDEHRKLDHMIQEVTANIETLKAELRPQDDLDNVEAELDMALHQTEDIEQDLESTSLDTKPPPLTSPVDLLSAQHAAQASTKVAEMERRVEQIAEKASIRRKLRPPINGSTAGRFGSNESIDSMDSSIRAPSIASAPESHLLMTSHHQPLILSPTKAMSTSGVQRSSRAHGRSKSAIPTAGARKRAPTAVIGLPLKTNNLIRSNSTNTYSNGAATNSKALSSPCLPNMFRCSWLPDQSPVSSAAVSPAVPDDTRPTKPQPARIASSPRGRPALQGPFQQYLSARRRSLSRDRDEEEGSGTRTQSLSLDRDYNNNSSPQYKRSRSHQPIALTSAGNTGLYPAPVPALSALSIDTSHHDYLPSLAPLSARSRHSPHSGRSELTSGDLSHEQQQIIQERQLEQDIRQTIQWIDKMEVTSTTLWSCPPLSADYDNVIRQCKQYNELLAQYHHFKSIVISINLVADRNTSRGGERDRLNSRWSQVSGYFPSRQLQLQAVLSQSQQLQRDVEGFSDDVTHSELKLLSGTHNKQMIQAEVRRTMSAVRSYITLLTSILTESGGKGKQFLNSLRNSETKCQNLLS